MLSCAITAKFDIVLDGISKKINRLKHEREVLHETVHTVVLHIHAAEGDRTGIHIPEPCDQIAEGGFSAGGADDGGGGFLENGRRNIVDDLSLVIGKGNMGKLDIVVFGLNALPSMSTVSSARMALALSTQTLTVCRSEK